MPPVCCNTALALSHLRKPGVLPGQAVTALFDDGSAGVGGEDGSVPRRGQERHEQRHHRVSTLPPYVHPGVKCGRQNAVQLSLHCSLLFGPHTTCPADRSVGLCVHLRLSGDKLTDEETQMFLQADRQIMLIHFK